MLRVWQFMTDPWCSSGGLSANGGIVNTGGALEGMRAVRTLSPLPFAQFEENVAALAADRWYIIFEPCLCLYFRKSPLHYIT